MADKLPAFGEKLYYWPLSLGKPGEAAGPITKNGVAEQRRSACCQVLVLDHEAACPACGAALAPSPAP